MWLLLTWGSAPGAATAADLVRAPVEVSADPPNDLAVTVYRAPSRVSGSIDLDRLEGFALISETRTVHLPAGESRLRFEGVADGIEPASAIVTGLADGVLEKNRDAALLSPSALIAASVGKSVVLTRSNRKTGRVERLPGEILSDAEGGVVFKTAQGIEALRCSGLPETLSFEPVTGLASHPTLSVLVRSAKAVTAQVTLSYLTRGFDWAADYTATVSADGKSMDLGAWVTLANGNGVGFAAARTQVVAGRLNRESGEVEPIDVGGPILATCWPQGSTSDFPVELQLAEASPLNARKKTRALLEMPAPMSAAITQTAVTAQRVTEEQLGDLKLYRVPERTTVASRQSKQVRLLDRGAIPISMIYSAALDSATEAAPRAAIKLLRTKNDAANHLGLPLPSGRVSIVALRGSEPLLTNQSGLRDLAVDEEVEIKLGESPDVQVAAVWMGDSRRVDVSNARPTAIDFELEVTLSEGARWVDSDHAAGFKNGRPLCRLRVPAHSTASLRYRIERFHGR